MRQRSWAGEQVATRATTERIAGPAAGGLLDVGAVELRRSARPGREDVGLLLLLLLLLLLAGRVELDLARGHRRRRQEA